MRQDPKYLEKKLNYSFKNDALLRLALTHRSHSKEHNERLEFLGDSVLQLVITNELYHRYPKATEGQLTRVRSTLVKKEMLTVLASELEINKYIFLGEGELRSGGLQRISILSDCVEAIFGAVFLDSDINKCSEVILGLYQDKLKSISLDEVIKDPKSTLQEWLQQRQYQLPEYEIANEILENNEKVFTIDCFIKDINIKTTAVAASRKKGEQIAAEKAMQEILDKKIK